MHVDNVCLGVLVLLLCGSAHAFAQAPKELQNKTITLRWSEYRVQRADAGDTTRSRTSSSMTVYVSDAGRPFVRLARQGERGRGNNTDRAPTGDEQKQGTGAGNLNPSFEGNTLNVVTTMRSGARIVQATFGAGFSNCSLRVIFGKEGGADLYHRGMDGRMYKIISTDVSGTSCSIRAGNAFGGS
jgi:hypothetical protein